VGALAPDRFRQEDGDMKFIPFYRRVEIIVIARRKDVADTVDLDRFLLVWFWHRPLSADADPVGSLIHAAWRMGREDFTPAEAREIIRASKQGKPLHRADAVGQYLRLTDAERSLWGIRTIGGLDVPKRQRTLRRKRLHREYMARKRLEAGAKPHSQSLSRKQPWRDEGVSRRTWERQRKREREVRH
jgi:hypothetical protein